MKDADRPHVSVVLATRDRPRFLATALRCYVAQRFRARELVVVDDGERFAVDEARVHAAGGRLVRVPPGTPLGEKLNAGVGASRGVLCQKMDDDDWYGPRYLETMVAAYERARTTSCRPTIAFVTPFLFFELARWELRVARDRNIPGATLLFARDAWDAVPFRHVRSHEDIWFLMDHRRLGAEFLAVDALEQFVAVRHAAHGDERGHTWTHNFDGERLEAQMARQLPVHARPPEALFPPWALAFYAALRDEAAGGARPLAAEGLRA